MNPTRSYALPSIKDASQAALDKNVYQVFFEFIQAVLKVRVVPVDSAQIRVSAHGVEFDSLQQDAVNLCTEDILRVGVEVVRSAAWDGDVVYSKG